MMETPTNNLAKIETLLEAYEQEIVKIAFLPAVAGTAARIVGGGVARGALFGGKKGAARAAHALTSGKGARRVVRKAVSATARDAVINKAVDAMDKTSALKSNSGQLKEAGVIRGAARLGMLGTKHSAKALWKHKRRVAGLGGAAALGAAAALPIAAAALPVVAAVKTQRAVRNGLARVRRQPATQGNTDNLQEK